MSNIISVLQKTGFTTNRVYQGVTDGEGTYPVVHVISNGDLVMYLEGVFVPSEDCIEWHTLSPPAPPFNVKE